MGIRHAKVSGIANNGAQPTLVGGEDWDADHVISGLSPAFIGAKAYGTNLSATGSSSGAWSLGSEEYDTDGFHSTSANTSRMTIPAGLGGKYLLIGTAAVQGSSAAVNLYLSFQKNGGGFTKDGTQYRDSNTNTDNGATAVTVMDLAAGDYVEFGYSWATGTITSNLTVYFSISKLDSGKVGQGIGAAAYSSATQTINDSQWTALTLATGERWDTDGFHDLVTNSSRMTIPAGLGGKYMVSGWGTFAFDGNGKRYLQARVNGNAITGTAYLWFGPGDSATNQQIGGTGVLDVAAGDYIELYAYEDRGGTLDVQAAGLTIMRLDSGGSSAKYPFATNYFAETKPATQDNTYDDEFDDSVGSSGAGNGLNAKWAWRNQGTSTTTFTKAGWLTMSIPATGSANIRILEIGTIDDGTYEARVALETNSNTSGDADIGICMVDSVNGDFYAFGLADVSGAGGIYVQRWTNVTTWNSNPGSVAVALTSAYLRFVKAGSTFSWYWSSDGIGWKRLATVTDAVGPTRIGIHCYETKNTGTTKGHVDYFRKTA